jgi:pimeloyl-ACP methyl ester carboxylesterase
MSGGRHPIAEVELLATAMSHHGCRVFLHDRRNCGHSSIHFDFDEPEEDVWVDDLHELLDGLRIERAFIVGNSRTARVALRFALRYPDRTAGLGLWGISGGASAVGHSPSGSSMTTTTESIFEHANKAGWRQCARSTILLGWLPFVPKIGQRYSL